MVCGISFGTDLGSEKQTDDLGQGDRDAYVFRWYSATWIFERFLFGY